ncbi:MAG: peptide chain release factor N(5)-glutamine methyltransferase [Parvibaculum sp.]|uniref:peptide chain release factor N(5)-glutamine methyltransferase n=1 Tax=Parvibaculum sp. TaxID=2024848 RepID=UPI00284CAAB9|nr:peptide chain release factor N(5)-glutamine methyltransferase [Parvibaculum sp.]MDR3497714.1 peptide chain release factor N(5)-glutamine methyltransferase [Parvibaculum sp.]
MTRDHAYRMLGWRLKQAGIATPELDARLLVQAAAGCDEIDMIREPGRMLAPGEVERLAGFEARRLAHEPVSRIIGIREFWGLAFKVTPATLDPRPDSETLVVAALELMPKDRAPSILDLGTGTGCLLIALLHERADARGLGVDISPEALKVAERNADALGVGGRVAFRHANWAEGIDQRFDLVISNPPYIAPAEIERLAPEVRDHDPRLALDGGADGLEAYRAIAALLPRLLCAEGHAVIELGDGQADDVRVIFERAGFVVPRIAPDIESRPRALVARLPRP